MVEKRLHKTAAAITLVLIFALGVATNAIAQAGPLILTLTGIESHAFPQVTVLLHVSDPGGPRDSLTATDFQIVEDGIQVPTEAIVVTSDASQGVRLVLAIDLSMNREALAQVKEGARTLINQLQPQDRAAILAFYDEVRVVQEFTDDRATLSAAIEGLQPEGNMTAFNQATIEALNKAAAFPEDVTAVVILTNSTDNIGNPSLDDVIANALSGKTSIYVIGFDKVTPEAVERVTTAVGGRSFILPGPEQVPATCQQLGESLRQGGYKLIFQSGLQADGEEHGLSVNVAYQDRKGWAEGRFTAVPGEVNVNLPALSDGDTVAGKVNLAVQATAPARIASVVYWLDGQRLSEVTAPPYRYEWDTSTLEPGTYHLNVVVTDRAGNKGQTVLDLQVIKPLQVTAAIPQTDVEIGTQVPIAVKIEALEEVTHVQFFADDKLIGTSSTPPYRFSLDSSTYQVGPHRITIRAEDCLGRTAETSLALHFLAPPPEPSRPSLIERLGFKSARHLWATVGVIALALALLSANLAGLLMALRAQGRRRQQVYHLEIFNQGNADACYALRAQDPMGALKFQFTLNGVELPRNTITGNGQQPMQAEITGGQASRDGIGSSDSSTTSSPQAPLTQTQQAASQALQTSNAVASTLTTIGQLLPGSAGASIQRAARPVHQTHSRINSTTARVRSKTGQISRLAPSSDVRATSQPTTFRQTSPSQARPSRGRVAPGEQAFQTLTETWLETPLVEPGETLPIDLLVVPVHSNHSQRYTFKVMSRVLDAPDSRWLSEEALVQIPGISWLRQILPYLLFTVVTAGVSLLAVLLLMRMSTFVAW
jgi:hypothetical protein